MKKLKIDTLDYSKIYPKFKIIPFLSILFVLAYSSLPFIKMLTFDGKVCSAIQLFKEAEWIFGVYFIIPQAVILVSFVFGLITVIKNKAFVAMDLSGAVGSVLGFIAFYSILFMGFAQMIDGATLYVQWMILIPIVYLVVNTLANFVCCLLSGMVKPPVPILICHCACVALLIVLAVVVASTPLVQLGEQMCGIFVDGRHVLFSEEFVSYGTSEKMILLWAATGLVAVVLAYLIERISHIVETYKMSLLSKNDYFLEFTFKEEHSDWKEYVKTQEGRLKLASVILDSCREDLKIKDGIILAIVGFVLLIAGMISFDGDDGTISIFLSLFGDIPSALCWTALLIGIALIAINVVTKRIIYNKLVEMEEAASKKNDTIKSEKEN